VVDIELISRFDVDDRELSLLHARAFGGEAGTITPWGRRLERHALTWVGAFDGATRVAPAGRTSGAGCPGTVSGRTRERKI
jgi:hypothetical protein